MNSKITGYEVYEGKANVVKYNISSNIHVIPCLSNGRNTRGIACLNDGRIMGCSDNSK